VTVFLLREGDYLEAEESRAIPHLTSGQISRFLEQAASMKRSAWVKAVREWARAAVASDSKL
jgi:hypothetical protein